MSNEKSRQSLEYRAKNYDRISAVIDKGGNNLVRVLALREGITASEYIRRAVLARGGLHRVPYPAMLHKLESVTTRDEARKAVLELQAADTIVSNVLQNLRGEEEPSFLLNATETEMQSFREVIVAIAKDIDAGMPITITDTQLGILQRMLANIEYQTN